MLLSTACSCSFHQIRNVKRLGWMSLCVCVCACVCAWWTVLMLVLLIWGIEDRKEIEWMGCYSKFGDLASKTFVASAYGSLVPEDQLMGWKGGRVKGEGDKMQEKLLICLLLANLNQTPREWEDIPTWDSDLGWMQLNSKMQLTVQLQCPAMKCKSMHTVSASLLPIPACWLLASLTDLANCVDKSNGRLFISQVFIFRL